MNTDKVDTLLWVRMFNTHNGNIQFFQGKCEFFNAMTLDKNNVLYFNLGVYRKINRMFFILYTLRIKSLVNLSSSGQQ